MKKQSLRSPSSSSGIRVVALGGGTGLSALLRGLKQHVVPRHDPYPTAQRPIVDLAAIVTVTDDGGSSGRLRRENRILPPGDIRNCMVALSKDEALLSRLFQYRFSPAAGSITTSAICFLPLTRHGISRAVRGTKPCPGARSHFSFDRFQRDSEAIWRTVSVPRQRASRQAVRRFVNDVGAAMFLRLPKLSKRFAKPI